AIGVLGLAPSKARLPTDSTWTAPWRETTATAPGAKPASTRRASRSRTRANPFAESPPVVTLSTSSRSRLYVWVIREETACTTGTASAERGAARPARRADPSRGTRRGSRRPPGAPGPPPAVERRKAAARLAARGRGGAY